MSYVEVDWKKEKSKRRNRKKEPVHDKKKYNKGLSKAMVATWEDSSDEDIDDDDEQSLIAIQESEDEPDKESDIKLISENLKLKLGTGKEIARDEQLKLEDDLRKVKDELYKKDEKVRFLKEELAKVQVKKSSQIWYTDSGGNVSFGNGKKGEIIRVRKVGKSDSHSIENVYLIDGLKYNLISVSQLCDRENMIAFTFTKYFVINLTTNKIVLQGKRVNNIYVVDLSTLSDNELTCLSVLDSDLLLWHKRLGHASLSQLNKLVSKDLVIGRPNIKLKEDNVCEACARGKQVRSSFKSKKMVSTTRTIELVRMDPCGP
ncbi:uncharacterized protein [Nicotiana tomentosiformis]|uniref:uncharacterized protein n=1 Tax=Nicotiana tomentosiformis TaxID=4098 RepID=UPI00388CEC95